jgi:hypothetical protein
MYAFFNKKRTFCDVTLYPVTMKKVNSLSLHRIGESVTFFSIFSSREKFNHTSKLGCPTFTLRGLTLCIYEEVLKRK